jgi:WD40 repeat protein
LYVKIFSKLKIFDLFIFKWKGIQEHIITNCQISHDGSSLCTGTDLDGILTIWDTKTGLIKTSIRNLHESLITSCQFNMKDDRIISTSSDKTTKFFDLISHHTTMTLRYTKKYVFIERD